MGYWGRTKFPGGDSLQHLLTCAAPSPCSNCALTPPSGGREGSNTHPTPPPIHTHPKERTTGLEEIKGKERVELLPSLGMRMLELGIAPFSLNSLHPQHLALSRRQNEGTV